MVELITVLCKLVQQFASILTLHRGLSANKNSMFIVFFQLLAWHEDDGNRVYTQIPHLSSLKIDSWLG